MAGFSGSEVARVRVTIVEFVLDSIRMPKIGPQLAAGQVEFALSPLGIVLLNVPRHREPK